MTPAKKPAFGMCRVRQAPTEAPALAGFFSLMLGGFPVTVLNPPLNRTTQKRQSPANRAKCLIYMGWLMGLEPTTTGITILDSTD